MTKAETQKVKLAAKARLRRLLEEQPKVLVQEWYKDEQTRQIVQSVVDKVLDENLPDSYDRPLFKDKSEAVYAMIYVVAQT